MATSNSIPSPAYLHECFTYNPETGDLTWKRRPLEHFKNARGMNIFNASYEGKVAGTLHAASGYVVTNVFGRPRRNHRIIWAMMFGEWPEQLDHINNIRSDNRIANLRTATISENGRNRGKQSNNKTGFKGVSYHKQAGKYEAKIHTKYLGLFLTAELAHAAYCAEADRLHGEFVNHG